MSVKTPQEHDVVRLVQAVEDDGTIFPIGTTGTIVSVYKGGEAFEVEVNENDRELALITVYSAQLVVIV